MLHVKFEIHGCSGFRELSHLKDLYARVDVNCERTDGKPDAFIMPYLSGCDKKNQGSNKPGGILVFEYMSSKQTYDKRLFSLYIFQLNWRESISSTAFHDSVRSSPNSVQYRV